MKRLIWMLMLVLLVQACVVCGSGEAWDAGREIRCRDQLPGCRLLQMVMMGSFDDLDSENTVSARILASAWRRLADITESDISHFSEEFGVDAQVVRLRWYGVLAECLRAEFAQVAQHTPERRVLALFLDDDPSPEADAERDEIRREITEAVYERIAAELDAPVGFVRWLIEEQ